MKKTTITLLMLLICLFTAGARNADSLFKEFKKAENASSVSISPLMMKIAGLCTDNEKDCEIIKKINSIKVLELENCSQQIKSDFRKCINELGADGYAEMLQANEQREQMRILVKMKKELIREIIILCSEDKAETMVYLTGKIRLEDIGQIIAHNGYAPSATEQQEKKKMQD